MGKPKTNPNPYWQDRMDAIFRYLDREESDFFADLVKVYADSARELQRDLYEFFAKYSEENNLTLSEASHRLYGEDLSDYRENAERYLKQAEKSPELLKRLNEQYVSARATRLDTLHMDVMTRLGVLKGVLEEKVVDHFFKVAGHSYTKAMGGHSGTINAPALKELVHTPLDGADFSQRLWRQVDKLGEDLREALRRGFVRGDHPRVMAKDLAKCYQVANSRAETLVRTEGTAIVNRSAAKRYMDAGLLYYRDLVHLDHRTSDICREIARKNERKLLSEMKTGVNAAPYHPNCRTGIVPDEEELMEGVGVDSGDEKAYNQGMIDSQSSGAISARRGDIKKQQDAFAERYYNQLRYSKRDSVVSKISKHSGVDPDTVSTALEHILDNTYLLWDSEEFQYRVRNFYPHYDMAQSLQRLMLGEAVLNDVTMLKHEALEHYYMNTLNMSYDDAHKLANQEYNYEEGE